MAFHQTTDRKLFAHEIAAYTDAELDKYLKENGKSVSHLSRVMSFIFCCPAEVKSSYVAVQDSKNLPPDFIQRLR